MIKVEVTPAAVRSMVRQVDYLSERASPETACKWNASVIEAINSLAQLPERGAFRRSSDSKHNGVRWIFVHNFPTYQIFYRYLKAEEKVRVIDIFHGSRNP